MNSDEFLQLIQVLKEERDKEFKQSTPWLDKSFKCKIVKTILGMSNLRDGGIIIFGIIQKMDDNFELEGMKDNDLASFKEDEVGSFVAEYADPFVKIRLDKVEYDNKKFIVILVDEFQDIPVLCRKDGIDLRRGALYIRSTRIPETVEVPSQTEMREVLDLAVAKNVRKFYTMQAAAGISLSPKPSDAERFLQQRKDLE